MRIDERGRGPSGLWFGSDEREGDVLLILDVFSVVGVGWTGEGDVVFEGVKDEVLIALVARAAWDKAAKETFLLSSLISDTFSLHEVDQEVQSDR